MNSHGHQHAGPAAPHRPLPRPGAAAASSLLRPSFLLIVMYSIAICFERIVEIEVFKPYRIIGFAMILMVLLGGRMKLDGLIRSCMLFVAIGTFLGAVHILVTGVPTDGLFLGVSMWLFNIATYIAICSLLRNRRELVIVLAVHTVAMLVASVDILQQSRALVALEGVAGRVSGDFKNPAHACLSMLVATLLLITMLRSAFVRRGALLGRVVIFLFGLAIILFELYVASLTGSRAGALQFVVGVMVYVAVIGWRRIAASLLLVAALLLAFGPQLGEFIEGKQGNILLQRAETKGLENDRYLLWRSGFDAYLDSYGMGLGIGQYRLVHQEYFRSYENIGDGRMADKKLSLHSDFVSALVEYGTFGAIIYVLIWRRVWRMARGLADADGRAIAMALVAASLVIALTHAVLVIFSLWFYLAILTLWARFGPQVPPDARLS